MVPSSVLRRVLGVPLVGDLLRIDNDKQTDGEDQVVAPAQALELMSDSGMHERPPAKQGTCLKIC